MRFAVLLIFGVFHNVISDQGSRPPKWGHPSKNPSQKNKENLKKTVQVLIQRYSYKCRDALMSSLSPNQRISLDHLCLRFHIRVQEGAITQSFLFKDGTFFFSNKPRSLVIQVSKLDDNSQLCVSPFTPLSMSDRRTCLANFPNTVTWCYEKGGSLKDNISHFFQISKIAQNWNTLLWKRGRQTLKNTDNYQRSCFEVFI